MTTPIHTPSKLVHEETNPKDLATRLQFLTSQSTDPSMIEPITTQLAPFRLVTASPTTKCAWWLDTSHKLADFSHRTMLFHNAAAFLRETVPEDELLLLGEVQKVNMEGKLLYEVIMEALQGCEDEEEKIVLRDTEQRLRLLIQNQDQWDKRTDRLVRQV
jgi:hypothetical protein